MTHRIALTLAAAILATLTQWNQGWACLFDAEQNFKIFRTAEVILVAKVTSYQVEPQQHRAIIEFETIRLIFGAGMSYRNPPKRWRAEWRNSTFGEPDAWKGPMHVIVGLDATIDRDGQAILYVVQQSCSSSSIVPASEENLQEILKDSGIRPAQIALKDIPWP